MFKYEDIYNDFKTKYFDQKNYLEAIKSFLLSISSANINISKNELYNLLEPNYIHEFKIPFVNKNNESEYYLGYRVWHSNKLGVYKGGIRFHPSVDVSTLKFLAFEQTLKNSLTGLPLGGAKGGSNFDTKGKTKEEVKRFIEAFMEQTSNIIGKDVDVPAGDIGVGKDEILMMVESYLKHNKTDNLGFITGKPVNLGGSKGRIEATGYGLVYIVCEALKKFYNTSIKNMKVIVSGSGNVSLNAAIKLNEVGALVVGMSDSSGYIYNEMGLDIDEIKRIKENRNQRISEYLVKHPNTLYSSFSSELFTKDADIILPCATQNEIDIDVIKKVNLNKVKIIAEGANRPLTNEAIEYIKNKTIFIPGKASNAGGVVVSYFEMQQNNLNVQWTFDEVDKKLREVMKDIFNRICFQSKQYNDEKNLLLGANIESLRNLVDF